MVAHPALILPVLLALSACAVVRPMLDRDFSGAERSACSNFAGSTVAPSAEQRSSTTVGCFGVVPVLPFGTNDANNAHVFTEEGLLLRGATEFRLLAGRECAGDYTALVVKYRTAGSASAVVEATNSWGMVLGSQMLRGRPSAKERTLIVRGISDALKHPAGARITPVQGDLLLGSLCLVGY